MICATRWRSLRNFVAEDMDAFVIWRGRIEERVRLLEQQFQGMRGQLVALVEPRAQRGNRRYLSLLGDHFSEEDVRVLAFQHDVNYEELRGDTLRGRLLSLVQELEHLGRLYQLEATVREMRPHVEWPPFV